MISVISCMIAGILLGIWSRKIQDIPLEELTTGFIWGLLLLLGMEVGANEKLMKSLPDLWMESVALTVATLVGCMIGSWLLWKHLQDNLSLKNIQENNSSANKIISTHTFPLKGSLIIITFFVAGICCGVLKLLPTTVIEDSSISFYVLCGLLICVGFSIGHDPTTLHRFKQLDAKLFILPILTIVCSLSGCIVYYLIVRERSLTDYLALGSGFGYYSLSSILITEYKGSELGTIALLCNITREILTLLGAPLMVRYFGRLAPISAGGATSMDTTLPIIVQCSGTEFAILSIAHGMIVDFSVPFLVSLFCTL